MLIKDSVPAIVLNPDMRFLTGGSLSPLLGEVTEDTATSPGPAQPTELPLQPPEPSTEPARWTFCRNFLGHARKPAFPL